MICVDVSCVRGGACLLLAGIGLGSVASAGETHTETFDGFASIRGTSFTVFAGTTNEAELASVGVGEDVFVGRIDELDLINGLYNDVASLDASEQVLAFGPTSFDDVVGVRFDRDVSRVAFTLYDTERRGSLSVRGIDREGVSIAGRNGIGAPAAGGRLEVVFASWVREVQFVTFGDGLMIDDLESTTEDPCLVDLASPIGVYNIDDVLAFLSAFADGDAGADLAGMDGLLNIDDVLAFLTAFAAGCP